MRATPVARAASVTTAATVGLIGYGAHKRRKSKKEGEAEDGVLDSEEV